jgi:hypothetical protein
MKIGQFISVFPFDLHFSVRPGEITYMVFSKYSA